MKNLQIVNAAITNDIYLANVLKDGTMGDNRKKVTSDVLGAALTHIVTMQERGTGFGMGYGTVNGDKILTVIPEEKAMAVKIASGYVSPNHDEGEEDHQLIHDLNRAYEAVSNQQAVIQEGEKERIDLDNFIDYLVGRMDGDRTALEADFKRLEESE